MFWIHPGGGGVLCYAHLAKSLGEDQPFFALQARGLDGEAPPREDIPAMAAVYIEELRAVQPEGPYQLGGWSLGGLIAFEMAQQLRDRGQNLHPLILLDTHLPDPRLLPERLGARSLLGALALQIGVDPGLLGAVQEELGDLPAADQLAPLLEYAHRAAVVPADFTLQDLRHLFAVFVANLRAAARYQPRPLDASIALFAASVTPPGDQGLAPELWRPFAGRGLEVVAVPGDHYSMLQDPHVEVLARRLR
jgi:thioesterase domain-containing protein